MDGSYSWHGRSFHRHFGFRRINMSLCFVLLACYLSNAKCATLQKAPDKGVADIENENVAVNGSRTFARRQSPFNPFITNTPASFGFPLYPSQASSFHQLPYQQFVTSVAPSKKEPREKESSDAELKSQSDSKKGKPKVKKDKPKRDEKLKVEVKSVENEEDKASGDDGTQRNCPACIGGECDAHLDPGTNISGIPIIQIIIAGLVGAFWAGIFLFILFNFIEHDHKHEGGYESGGYGAPVSQYGAPHSEYGAPQSEYGTPQQSSDSSYNIHRIANRYGRSSHGFSFNDLSNWVSGAIDKLTELYNEKESG